MRDDVDVFDAPGNPLLSLPLGEVPVPRRTRDVRLGGEVSMELAEPRRGREPEESSLDLALKDERVGREPGNRVARWRPARTQYQHRGGHRRDPGSRALVSDI